MQEIKHTISVQLQQMQMLMHRMGLHPFGNMRSPHRGQGRVLALLKLKPEISQKELTYLLNMSKQATAELLAKLERNGYITREAAEDDKRVMMIRLNEAGAEAADEVDDAAPELETILDCLGEEELVALSDYLGRIIERYEEQYPDEQFAQRRQKMEEFMSAYGHGFAQGPGLRHGGHCHRSHGAHCNKNHGEHGHKGHGAHCNKNHGEHGHGRH